MKKGQVHNCEELHEVSHMFINKNKLYIIYIFIFIVICLQLMLQFQIWTGVAIF
jgi:hypothetical protein